MILVIQLCLFILACFVVWCERTPFFSDKFNSVLSRLFISTGFIGLSYHAPELNNYHTSYQFFTMLICVALTFLTIKFVLKRYEHNKLRIELRKKKNG